MRVVGSVQDECLWGRKNEKQQVTCADRLASTQWFGFGFFSVSFHSLGSKRKNTCHTITNINTSSSVSISILL